MKTLTAINQKGGVGKTTTAIATAHGLAKRGYRVLLVDLDAQQNASSVLQVKGKPPSSLDVLIGEAEAVEAIKSAGSIDAIASDAQAAHADKLLEGIGAEYRLKEALEPLEGTYDFCIVDTPPALGTLTINALTAADAAVIPAQADMFSLEGIGQLAGTLEAVKRYANPSLSIAGILLTRFNSRTTLSRDIAEAAEEAAAALGTTLFESTIREGIAVKEAQAMKQSLFDYAPRAKVTQDYSAYVDELLGRL